MRMVPAVLLGRLAQAEEIRRVYQEGSRHSTGLLVLHTRPNSLGVVRVGVVVGRRFGSAVRRNRLRRRLREAVRAERDRMTGNIDLVVVPRAPATQAVYAELRAAVAATFKAAGLLRKGAGGNHER